MKIEDILPEELVAPDLEARAALAVEDLERAGGFDRSHLLVVTTTGTGWVVSQSSRERRHCDVWACCGCVGSLE